MTKHPREADRLKKIVEAFPKITVTVLGDLVADEFVFGEISRVSREAPVLILKHRERTVVPGGGANAANNLADLGVNVLPVGVVGDDEPGRMLLKYFRHKRIAVSGVLKDKSYTTVTKTRITAGMTHTARQQVVRIDREPKDPPNPHLTRELYLAARNYAHASDALLVSDYGYGAATPAIVTALQEKGKLGSVPIIVDSRYRLVQYSGNSGWPAPGRLRRTSSARNALPAPPPQCGHPPPAPPPNRDRTPRYPGSPSCATACPHLPPPEGTCSSVPLRALPAGPGSWGTIFHR